MIDHVTINVNNFEKSKNFYKKVLGILGVKILNELGAEYCSFGKDKAIFFLGIADDKHIVTQNVHLAFLANSKEEVIKFYNLSIELGAVDNGLPGYRNEYNEGYYAGYVVDFNGNNIEVVFREKEIDVDSDMGMFNNWNELKKKIDQKNNRAYAHPREVWWCSLGNNIGSEVNGKNYKFERPVLVLKVYSSDSILVLPITSKIKNDTFHKKIIIKNNKEVYIKLTQIRVISTKRLSRKVDKINIENFLEIKKLLFNYI